jgi:hypothetical protein
MSISVHVLVGSVPTTEVQLLRTAPILSQLRTHPTLGGLDLYFAGRRLLPLDSCGRLGLVEGSLLEGCFPSVSLAASASADPEPSRVITWADEVAAATASVPIPTHAVGQTAGRRTAL